MKYILFLFALLMSICAYSQVSFGIKGGLNLANQKMEIEFEDLKVGRDGKYIPSFHLGGLADIKVSNRISIRPELIFTGKGSKFTEEDENGNTTTATFRPYYLEVPVTILFNHELPGGTGLYVGLGPYLSYGLFGKVKSEDQEENIFEDEGLKRFDAGLYYQGGVKLGSGIFFNMAFAHGFANTADVQDLGDITLTMKNNVFMFSIGKTF